MTKELLERIDAMICEICKKEKTIKRAKLIGKIIKIKGRVKVLQSKLNIIDLQITEIGENI